MPRPAELAQPLFPAPPPARVLFIARFPHLPSFPPLCSSAGELAPLSPSSQTQDWDPSSPPRPRVLREPAGRGGHPESPKVGSPRCVMQGRGQTPLHRSAPSCPNCTPTQRLLGLPGSHLPSSPPPSPPCTSSSSCRCPHTPSILQEAHSCSQRRCWRHLQ